MQHPLLEHLARETAALHGQGLFKEERVITSAQQAAVDVRAEEGTREVINLCANNYLGLADDPRLVDGRQGCDGDPWLRHGLRALHLRHPRPPPRARRGASPASSAQEDAILYAACFDANGGLFEPLLGDRDAIVSDALNHASIIDGIRLCKAQALPLCNNSDMGELESRLKEAREGKDARCTS